MRLLGGQARLGTGLPARPGTGQEPRSHSGAPLVKPLPQPCHIVPGIIAQRLCYSTLGGVQCQGLVKVLGVSRKIMDDVMLNEAKHLLFLSLH